MSTAVVATSSSSSMDPSSASATTTTTNSSSIPPPPLTQSSNGSSSAGAGGGGGGENVKAATTSTTATATTANTARDEESGNTNENGHHHQQQGAPEAGSSTPNDNNNTGPSVQGSSSQHNSGEESSSFSLVSATTGGPFFPATAAAPPPPPGAPGAGTAAGGTASACSSIPSNPPSTSSVASASASAPPTECGSVGPGGAGGSTGGGAAGVATLGEDERSNKDHPCLPAELRNILTAVAQTGTCSWLPWTMEGSVGTSTDASSAGGAAAVAVAAAAAHKAASATIAAAPHLKRPLPVSAAAAAAAALHPTHRPAGTAGQQHPATSTATAAKQNHSSYRRFTASATASASGPPPRKKHRNGLHNSVRSSKRRFVGDAGGVAAAGGGAAGSKKRPLLLIRTGNSAATSVFSPGSVGSGRTSGSEAEDMDTSQYDSEGTSATSASDLSFDRNLRNRMARNSLFGMAHATVPTPHEELSVSSVSFKCQKDAFRAALQLVLDHFYKNRGGYRLSPAEIRRNATLIAQTEESPGNTTSAADTDHHADPVDSETPSPAISAVAIFQQRRHRMLNFLDPNNGRADKPRKTAPLSSSQLPSEDGPPFTIQRIAEVLASPERYYTQTHKLCNCLEKLLLITSSAKSFGGAFGGDTSQRRREELELVALAEEQSRIQSEYRHRRHRHHASSVSGGITAEGGTGARHSETGDHSKKDAPAEADGKGDDVDPSGAEPDAQSPEEGSDADSRELLEAAARASLRTKFDHVGIDPHSSAVVNRDVRSIAENRGMTNSPPPPSLSMSAGCAVLPGHNGRLRHGHTSSPPDQEHPGSLARVPSPILFNHGNNDCSSSPPMGPMPIHVNPPNLQLLHMHRNATLAGVSHFELTSLSHNPEGGSALAAAPGLTSMTSASNKDADLESRSSASSDVDSESDVSFDDSASDRSDGSDSGHHEPFSAARAMALNRMQQQRLQQSRLLTSLHHGSGNQGEGFHPDSEYQSGDSIDSTRAEDSGGSDSSSSDVAD